MCIYIYVWYIEYIVDRLHVYVHYHVFLAIGEGEKARYQCCGTWRQVVHRGFLGAKPQEVWQKTAFAVAAIEIIEGFHKLDQLCTVQDVE